MGATQASRVRPHGPRAAVKRALAALPSGRPTGAVVLIYHRVGGGSSDERDVTARGFADQLDLLGDRRVVHLDDAVDAVRAGSSEPGVVLTFDDGFADVYHHAWPELARRGLPFTLYLTTAYVGRAMHWDGSTAQDTAGPGLSWAQVQEMAASGLCRVENHTHTHVRPDLLSTEELDRCSDLVEDRTGRRPRHFAFTWGVPVPRLEPELAVRFRTAATGRVGSLRPGGHLLALPRVPVRGSDPLAFFRAKVAGNLWQERVYGALVRTAKSAGARG